MKAAVFKEKEILAVENISDPEPGDDEIVVQVEYCAICGSDLHRYAFGMMNPGTIMGHEYSGQVVGFGKEVEGYNIGDRVARWGGKIIPGRELPNYPPRYNARERGFLPIKPGAYAEYVVEKAEKITKIPDRMTFLDASLLEPLAVAVHSVRTSKIRLGDNIVVLGAGPIGLFTQQCASAAGGLKIYVSDMNSHRLKIASELGAHEVFKADQVDLLKEIIALTEIGADVVFECAGAKPTFQQALEVAKMRGRVMLVSLAWEQVDCLPVEWVGREVEMKTCYGHRNSDWAVAMDLLLDDKIETEPMISKIVELDEIQNTFQELLNPATSDVQVIVKCS